jgi:hypothetical protein
VIDNYEMIEKIRRRTGMGLGGIYLISVISALLADDKYHYIDNIPLPFYVILISFLLFSAFYALFIVDFVSEKSTYFICKKIYGAEFSSEQQADIDGFISKKFDALKNDNRNDSISPSSDGCLLVVVKIPLYASLTAGFGWLIITKAYEFFAYLGSKISALAGTWHQPQLNIEKIDVVIWLLVAITFLLVQILLELRRSR